MWAKRGRWRRATHRYSVKVPIAWPVRRREGRMRYAPTYLPFVRWWFVHCWCVIFCISPATVRAYCIRPDVGEHEMIAVNKSLRLFDFLTQDMSEHVNFPWNAVPNELKMSICVGRLSIFCWTRVWFSKIILNLRHQINGYKIVNSIMKDHK